MKYLLKKTAIALTLFFITTISLSQNKDKIYLAHDHNYYPNYSYIVTEIIIHSDSTYTRKNYNVSSKKDWKTFRKYTPEISKGYILYKKKITILTREKNNPKTFHSWTVKIKKRKLIFFLPNRKGKMRRTYVYKRVDSN